MRDSKVNIFLPGIKACFKEYLDKNPTYLTEWEEIWKDGRIEKINLFRAKRQNLEHIIQNKKLVIKYHIAGWKTKKISSFLEIHYGTISKWIREYKKKK